MPQSKRTRRTAEGARQEILDAAERRLREHGPDGVRLQQIAADVGVSHPAILHHFESLEDLIQQVVERAVEKLRDEIVRSLDAVNKENGPVAFDMMERAFSVVVDKGYARLIVWLILSGHARDEGDQRLKMIAEVAHRSRGRVDADSGAPFEETLFRTLLVAFVLLGEGAAGAAMMRSAGLADDPGATKRFREWLAALITLPRPS